MFNTVGLATNESGYNYLSMCHTSSTTKAEELVSKYKESAKRKYPKVDFYTHENFAVIESDKAEETLLLALYINCLMLQ